MNNRKNVYTGLSISLRSVLFLVALTLFGVNTMYAEFSRMKITAYNTNQFHNNTDSLIPVGSSKLESGEQFPMFPGGMNGIREFLIANTNYPYEAVKDCMEGTVLVRFAVGKDGSVSKVKVLKRISKCLDAEAMRVVSSLPKFVPGKRNGEPVRVFYTITVNFIRPRDNAQMESVTWIRHNKDIKNNDKLVYNSPLPKDSLCVPPQYRGGMSAFVKYIHKTQKYPKQSLKNNTSGRVIVSFMIDTHGKIKYPVITEHLDPFTDAEALRVVKSMPRWIPCKGRGGEDMDCHVSVPFGFKSPSKIKEEANNAVFDYYGIEQMATPNFNLNKYFTDNTKYPVKALQDSVEGDVQVAFTVNNKGKIINPYIKKGANKYLDAEAMKAIMTMPDWDPAWRQPGPVGIKYLETFQFRCRNGEAKPKVSVKPLDTAPPDYSDMRNKDLFIFYAY